VRRTSAVRVPGHSEALSLVLLVALAAGCGGSDPDRASSELPNVLLVTIDTLRADHCTPYGYGRETTPRLAALAESGVLFECVYAPIPSTAPSHSTIFTSTEPRTHGVSRNGASLPADATTLAEILRGHGYRTAAFVSSFVLDRKFGLDQGFDLYDDDFEGAATTLGSGIQWEGREVEETFDRRAAETTDRVLDWIARKEDSPPFFLWVHYFDPHGPYVPPPRYREQFRRETSRNRRKKIIDRYDAEVRYTDDQLARLLDAVGAAAPPAGTLTIVAGDHGEGLNQHQWLAHGLHLYEEAVRVPLVVHWPGVVPEGRRVRGPVGLIDLLPTILGTLALPAENAILEGTDLSPSWETVGPKGIYSANPGDRAIFLERRYYESEEVVDGMGRTVRVRGSKWGVRWRRWKYIVAPEEDTAELFDLAADPGELRNVVEKHPDVSRKLREIMQEWHSREPTHTLRAERNLSDEDARRLRALGYLR
jgi:arylsulfatase A-like enzyme